MTFRKFVSILLLGLPLAGGAGCKRPNLPNAVKEVPSTEAPAAVQAEAPAPVPPPPPPKVRQADTKGSVIVLCYHRFEDRPKDSMAVTPAAFESEMKALGEHGFSVISMQDFLAWRRGEKSIPEKACLITIDDGYRSGHDVAWPILKKFGYPFTMFIYTAFVKGGALAGGASLSWQELAEMRDAGVDIQSHTVNHQNLRIKKGKYQSQFPSYEEWLRNETAGSKRLLESQLGISVQALAYPYGVHSDQIRTAAMEAGYEAAFTTYGQRLTFHSPADQLGRYAIESNKPKIFTDALAMIGGGGGMVETSASSGAAAAAVTGQLAAVSMLTVPGEGETVRNLKPAIKANLATMGNVEPGTVEIRVSGVGAVPVKYDPGTRLAEGTLMQPLKDRQVTVLLSAQVNGRRVETRWNFICDAIPAPPGALPAPTPAPGAGKAPVHPAPAPAAPAPAPAVAPRASSQPAVPPPAPVPGSTPAPGVPPSAPAPDAGGAPSSPAASAEPAVSGGVLR